MNRAYASEDLMAESFHYFVVKPIRHWALKMRGFTTTETTTSLCYMLDLLENITLFSALLIYISGSESF
jgi:hypothetical protein